MRVEQEAIRRGNAPVVISTLLSLLVVAAAVAVVAYLVLRTPSSAVDSAERLEPVGTALPAPTEQPTLPTPVPTVEPEPAAPGFTGEAPEAAGLPTVAAPQETGPTPTPRVIALPTAAPPAAPTALPAAPTALPAAPTALPAPTLPPSVPMEAVPVVALAPVEVEAPAAPTAAAVQSQSASEPTPEPVELDDDPFNIFGDENGSGIVPAQTGGLERARALQNDAGRDEDEDRDIFNPVGAPVIDVNEIVPAIDDEPIVTGSDGTVEIVMPDIEAMIDEITARATDPNRNPNVGDASQSDDNRDRENGDRETTTSENRRKSARDRINEHLGRETPNPISPSGRNDEIPAIERAAPNNGDGSNDGGNRNQEECKAPFANIPEDMRPDNFPFDTC